MGGRPHKGMDPEKVSKRGAGKDLEKVIRNINNAPHGNNDQEQVNDKVVDSAAGGGNSIAKQGKARTRQSDEKQVPNIKRNRKKPDPTPITQGERDEAAQKIIIAFREFKESRHDKRGKGRRQRGSDGNRLKGCSRWSRLVKSVFALWSKIEPFSRRIRPRAT